MDLYWFPLGRLICAFVLFVLVTVDWEKVALHRRQLKSTRRVR